MNDVIQLKITLHGTKPAIWRRVLVAKSTSVFTLHGIIQAAMGWDDSHLFEFVINGRRIGVPFEGDDDWSDELMDATNTMLDAVITDTKAKISYVYDFGDNWEHLIKVEKFLPKSGNPSVPICLDGELNCPPEDCGGVWGFYDLLEKAQNKKHPEHKEMLEWLGAHYDAEHFDRELVNKNLKALVR